jgi:hypothetical protein
MPGVLIAAGSLAMVPVLAIFGDASHACPLSGPFDNEHCLIVNAVWLTNLSQMFIYP